MGLSWERKRNWTESFPGKWVALTCAFRCEGPVPPILSNKRKRVTLCDAVSRVTQCDHPAGEDRVCQHWFNLNLLRRAAYDDVTVVALFATTDFVSSCEQLNSVQNSA